MSSLLKVSPGMRPLFLSQNMEAKLPEKKIPSTAAKATMRSPKVAVRLPIHCSAQSAFFFTHGRVSIALNKKSLERHNECILQDSYIRNKCLAMSALPGPGQRGKSKKYWLDVMKGDLCVNCLTDAEEIV